MLLAPLREIPQTLTEPPIVHCTALVEKQRPFRFAASSTLLLTRNSFGSTFDPNFQPNRKTFRLHSRSTFVVSKRSTAQRNGLCSLRKSFLNRFCFESSELLLPFYPYQFSYRAAYRPFDFRVDIHP